MNNIVNEIVEHSKKNNPRSISIIVFVTLLIINVCLEMMAYNASNIDKGLLNNDRLKLIQIFGENSKGDMNLDESVIKSIEHVLFVEKTYPITVDLVDENGDLYEDDVLFVYKMPKQYGNYVGIEGELKDNVIYCSKEYISSDAIQNAKMQDELSQKGIKLEVYEGVPPQMLQGDSFVNEKTYDKIMNIERDILGAEYADILYSTPQYLVGIDETANIYKITDTIEKAFQDYKIKSYYQASGLKDFVDNSSHMIEFQLVVAILIFMISLIIIYIIIGLLVGNHEKNMMVLYINGMPRNIIITQLYSLLKKVLIKPCIIIVFLSCLCNVILDKIVFKETSGLVFTLLILLVDVIVIIFNMIFIKWTIKRKIYRKTSNENITECLRN